MILTPQIHVFIPLILLSFSSVTDSGDNNELIQSSFPKALNEHKENIASSESKYSIQMGGALDGFNTVYYSETYAKFMRGEPKFEPNEYVIIENTGDIDIINPRIVINGRRDWYSIDDILASILEPDMTDSEKAMAIYNFTSSIEVQCHENNRRVGPPFPDDNSNPSRNTFKERANPVKAANYYYCSGCSLAAANFVILCRHAGLTSRAVWMCPLDVYETHCVAEVWYDGDWHLYDPEVRTFYLEGDNETIASYEDLHKYPALVDRTHDGGFASPGTKSHAIYYEAHYPPHVMPVEQWTSTLAMTLRSGEKFIWRWDHISKFRYGDNHRNRDYLPHRLANGKMIYHPNLAKLESRSGILSELNIKTSIEDGNLPHMHPAIIGMPAYVIYKIKTAYPIVGGVVGGKFYRETEQDHCKIYISVDDSDWIQVWSSNETGDIEKYVAIDKYIDPKPTPAHYEYYVKFEFNAEDEIANAGINAVYIETDVQMSSTALPALSVGTNEVIYRDDTDRPHQIQVTHGWNESSESAPPLPPTSPINPRDGACIEAEFLEWQAAECPDGDTIAEYHIQVSSREDMLYPISPSFDRIIFSQNPQWDIPKGWFISGNIYFWRVRAMNKWGVWSMWSQVWSFSAD